MMQSPSSAEPARRRALDALHPACARGQPDVLPEAGNRAEGICATPPPHITTGDCEADLSAGDGNGLPGKVRAVQSPSGLAVNACARPRRRIADPALPVAQKCPTSLWGRRAPKRDVALAWPDGVGNAVAQCPQRRDGLMGRQGLRHAGGAAARCDGPRGAA